MLFYSLHIYQALDILIHLSHWRVACFDSCGCTVIFHLGCSCGGFTSFLLRPLPSCRLSRSFTFEKHLHIHTLGSEINRQCGRYRGRWNRSPCACLCIWVKYNLIPVLMCLSNSPPDILTAFERRPCHLHTSSRFLITVSCDWWKPWLNLAQIGSTQLPMKLSMWCINFMGNMSSWRGCEYLKKCNSISRVSVCTVRFCKPGIVLKLHFNSGLVLGQKHDVFQIQKYVGLITC